MGVVLWIVQGILAFFCITGASWRFFNYEEAAKDVASMAALPYSAWTAINLFEILCAVLLIVPGAFHIKPAVTGVAAALLAVELLFMTGLHVKYFGFQMQATNPAMWSGMLCLLAAFVAYGRFVLRPF